MRTAHPGPGMMARSTLSQHMDRTATERATAGTVISGCLGWLDLEGFLRIWRLPIGCRPLV